jgi:hypothetical protein
MTDAALNFKSAVMDLDHLNPIQSTLDNTQEMYYALKVLQSEHKIDRFHLKCAVAFPEKE